MMLIPNKIRLSRIETKSVNESKRSVYVNRVIDRGSYLESLMYK